MRILVGNGFYECSDGYGDAMEVMLCNVRFRIFSVEELFGRIILVVKAYDVKIDYCSHRLDAYYHLCILSDYAV